MSPNSCAIVERMFSPKLILRSPQLRFSEDKTNRSREIFRSVLETLAHGQRTRLSRDAARSVLVGLICSNGAFSFLCGRCGRVVFVPAWYCQGRCSHMGSMHENYSTSTSWF
jgi:hypothetical protein